LSSKLIIAFTKTAGASKLLLKMLDIPDTIQNFDSTENLDDLDDLRGIKRIKEYQIGDLIRVAVPKIDY
ncbi:21575_t:CDS:2, partial [Rhizophagus irregularis]